MKSSSFKVIISREISSTAIFIFKNIWNDSINLHVKRGVIMVNFWNVVSIKKLSFEKFNTKNLCKRKENYEK